MSKKLGVKIPPGGISQNFVMNFPHAFLLEDRFLLDLGKIYSLLELMKLAPGLLRALPQRKLSYRTHDRDGIILKSNLAHAGQGLERLDKKGRGGGRQVQFKANADNFGSFFLLFRKLQIFGT